MKVAGCANRGDLNEALGWFVIAADSNPESLTSSPAL
jgi:hypothetical protein